MSAPDISYLLVPILVLFSALLGATLFAVAFAPETDGRLFNRDSKSGLRREIATVRLGRVLKRRGLAVASFAERLSPDQLQQAVDNCHNCHNASRCEAVLRDFLPGGDYAFCASSAVIARAAQITEEASSLARIE